MDTEVYDDGIERAAHSNKGASGAERWMNCPGSSALIAALKLPQSDEKDYTREGLAMHECAADCLARDIDTWEIAGETYHNTVIDGPMAEGIQMYLDRVRPSMGGGGPKAGRFHGHHFFIEAKLAAPDVHEAMFGSVDFGAMVSAIIARAILSRMSSAPQKAVDGFLDVTDLKGGEGIVVEAEDNPQMKYYAFMLIHTKFPDLDDDFPVRLTIVQPRAFSYDGPIREWWTTVGKIKAWVVRELLPAMNSTDDGLSSGDWCRFCPAKLVCPLVVSLFRAASSYDPKEVIDVTNESLGPSYGKVAAVKFYIKALEDEVYRRLNLGSSVKGTKLVNKKANRIFTPTVTEKVEGKDVEVPVEQAIKSRFGDGAFTVPELKTPADLEKLGPAAKEFVKQHAYMPVTGLTVAVEGDRRTEIKVQTAHERFGAAIANALQHEP